MSKPCRWFLWIGGPLCDGCGRPPETHRGLEWHGQGSPFDHAKPLHVPWSEYGPGKRLNVPLFTRVFGVPTEVAE